MPFDEDPDDERPVPDRYLPQDDRLWRHPSELGSAALPRPADLPAEQTSRRGPALATLAGAVVAGAVVAIGAMWFAGPTRVVEHQVSRPLGTATVAGSAMKDKAAVKDTAVASFTANTVPTERLAQQMSPSLALLRVNREGTWTTETAVWIDERGTLVASAPALWGATELLVVGTDGRARRAQLAGIDAATGLAALVTDRTSGQAITKTARPTRVGQPAAVVGAGSGRDTGTATVSGVIVRSTSIRATVDGVVLHDSIQLDREMPDDVAGGGLVDAQGTVLGLVVGNSSERQLAAVTPGTVLIATGTELRDRGTVRRAWLGVRAIDLDPAAASLLDIPGGALITSVDPNSPAARAGITRDDIVVKVGTTRIGDATDLVLALRHHHPGDRTTVTVWRGDAEQVETTTLGG